MSEQIGTRATQGKQLPGLLAITVMRRGADYLLCPFFGKCDGLLTVEPDKLTVAFLANSERSAGPLANLIIEGGVTRLICGFVPPQERARLEAAGIDVRLGSCTCGIDQLMIDFAELPRA